MKKYLFFVCVLLGASSYATEVDLGKSIISPDYIEIQKLKATKNVIVVDKKDIEEKGYQSVSQVLNDVPGITVGTTGVDGDIDIRGQGAGQSKKNIQVMIDGAPVTTLVSHPMTTNYNVVPVEQIEKIEVIPGGGSVLYGSGTAGGVINITTNLKSMNKPKNKVGYEFTIDNEKKYYTNLGAKVTDNLILQLNYSKSEKDWYFKDTYNNTQYFSTGLNYKINDNQNISFQYNHFDEEGKTIKVISKRNLKKYGRDYVPRETKITVGLDEHGLKIRKKVRNYLPTDRKSDNFKTSYDYRINDRLFLQVDGFKNKGYFTGLTDENTKMDQDTFGGKAKLNVSYGEKNSILFGADWVKQNAELRYSDYRMKKDANGNYIKYNGKYTYYEKPLSFEYEKYVKALYFLNILEKNNFEFTQGMRYDVTDWSFDKKSAVASGSETRTTNNRNYELSVGYNYRDTGKVYARYERGFTGPDGVEVSDQVLDANGTKTYQATKAEDEIFDMYEVGIRDYIFGSAISLTGFYSNTDNQMDRIYMNGIKEMKTVNFLKTKRYGLEANAVQNVGKFTFEESYSYLKGKSGYNSKGEAAVAAGNKINWSESGLQKVPKHTVMLKADYDITDNLSIGMDWKYTGSYNNFYDEANREEDDVVKSNTVVGLSIAYNNPEGFGVYGGIRNLFNEEYYGYTSAGRYGTVVPQEERTFYAGFSYTF